MKFQVNSSFINKISVTYPRLDCDQKQPINLLQYLLRLQIENLFTDMTLSSSPILDKCRIGFRGGNRGYSPCLQKRDFKKKIYSN